jgi:hypothetical protein
MIKIYAKPKEYKMYGGDGCEYMHFHRPTKHEKSCLTNLK